MPTIVKLKDTSRKQAVLDFLYQESYKIPINRVRVHYSGKSQYYTLNGQPFIFHDFAQVGLKAIQRPDAIRQNHHPRAVVEINIYYQNIKANKSAKTFLLSVTDFNEILTELLDD